MNKKKNTLKKYQPYFFIAPSVILILAVYAYPIFRVFALSLQSYDYTNFSNRGFIGLANFVKLFTDDRIFKFATIFSLKWVVVQVVAQLVFGLIMALVLNANFRGRGLVRSLTLVPWAVSGVLTTMLWILILNQSIGLIGKIFIMCGVSPGDVPAFLANPKLVFFSVSICELWKGIPFFAVTLLAAMQGIPSDIYEAATIDGANKVQSFWRITLPYLKETIVLTTLLRTIWEFNATDMIFTLTGGGPANLTTTLPVYMLKTAVVNGDYGYGSAIGVVIFFALILFAALYMKLSNWDGEADE